jgi:hypothetical protein
MGFSEHAMFRRRNNMLYLIEVEYLGPNRKSKGRHAHKIQVSNQPGRKNLSLEPCTKGWLGTTDNWDKWALGEFTPQGALEYLQNLELAVELDTIAPGDEFYLEV